MVGRPEAHLPPDSPLDAIGEAIVVAMHDRLDLAVMIAEAFGADGRHGALLQELDEAILLATLAQLAPEDRTYNLPSSETPALLR